jgi:hypothetical protein
MVTPWYDHPWVIAVITLVYATFALLQWLAIKRQGRIMLEQSRLTKQSTTAMEKSVELQEAAFRQWVDIDKWTLSERFIEGEHYELNFHFDLVNRTKLPLTIREVYATIEKQESATRQNNALAPEGRHPVEASVTVSKETFEGYVNNKTMPVFQFKGLIVFTDVLGKRREQPFEGWVSCFRRKVMFSGIQPVPDEHDNQPS